MILNATFDKDAYFLCCADFFRTTANQNFHTALNFMYHIVLFIYYLKKEIFHMPYTFSATFCPLQFCSF